MTEPHEEGNAAIASDRPPNAAVAQLDRASVYGTEGQRFESSQPRFTTLLMMMDEDFMRLAIAEAQAAAALDEVPVGAVIVKDGAVIARGGNRREGAADPTAHAEMIAIRQAAQAIGGWRLEDATLYVTQEPCPMCAGAIVNARVARVVYGCDNPKAGAVRTLYHLLEDPRLNHRVTVVPGVLASECGRLLSGFFETLRKKT